MLTLLTKNSIIVSSAYIIATSLTVTLSEDWPIGLTTIRTAGGNYQQIQKEKRKHDYKTF